MDEVVDYIMTARDALPARRTHSVGGCQLLFRHPPPGREHRQPYLLRPRRHSPGPLSARCQPRPHHTGCRVHVFMCVCVCACVHVCACVCASCVHVYMCRDSPRSPLPSLLSPLPSLLSTLSPLPSHISRHFSIRVVLQPAGRHCRLPRCSDTSTLCDRSSPKEPGQTCLFWKEM